MKRVVTILMLGFAFSLLVGCDFLRSLAGRPTSQDIEARKDAIAANELVRKSRLDSLEAARKLEADSLKAMSELPALVDMVPVSRTGNKVKLEHRYYMVIGAFSNASNARRLADKYNAAGYESVLLPYRSGFTAVALCPSDRIADLYASFLKLQADSVNCPKEIWVLVNE